MAATATRKAAKRKRPVKKRRRRPVPQVRTSERISFKGCRWQWQRGYVDLLKPHEEAPALRFGTLVHEALEVRYPPGIKRGPKPAETFEKIFTKNLREMEKTWGFRDPDGEWADAGELGVNMLENYVATYGRDEEWKVLASEMTFTVPVYGRGRLPDEDTPHLWLPAEPDDDGAVHLFNYVGTMDGVWQNRMDGNVRINDYKTTKGDPVKEALAKLLLDEQGTAYWTWGVDYLIAEKILKPRELQALDGMLYTFLRKQKKDERPVNAQGQSLNKDGTISKKQPGQYFHRELVYRDEGQQTMARQRVLDEFADMQAVRNGQAPAYKSPGLSFPYQQCKGCAFFDICELHEIGADWEDLRDATMDTWDPYEAHAVKESEQR